MSKSFLKNSLVENLLKASIIVVFVLTLVYAFIDFSFDSDFFRRDLRDKYGQVLGVNLSVVIEGDPEKPIVQVENGCTNYLPYIKLSWPADPLAASFEIIRNGETLAIGITGTEYLDETPEMIGTNSYIVKAIGINSAIMSSDLIDQAAIICERPETISEESLADPTCKIKTIDSISIDQLVFPIILRNNQPIFAGNTNMDEAKIRIEIIGESGIIGQLRANRNGFWQWQPPIALADGTYEIRVKAIDPDDASRDKTDTLIFRINKGGQESLIPPSQMNLAQLPFEFVMAIQNPEKIVYSGEDLALLINFKSAEDFISQNESLIYKIFDPDGNLIVEISDEILIAQNQEIKKSIRLDNLLKNGQYKISVATAYGSFDIFAEDYFFLKEDPLLRLGTREITLTALLSGLGWIIILFLILLLIFLLLLFLESRLAQDGRWQITERALNKAGFLGKRREANR